MPVHIYRDGPRVAMNAPWSPNLPTKCKSVEGWSFRKDKTWSWPLSMTTLRRLRDVFGDALDPDAELLEWARQEVKREKRLKRVSRKSDETLKHIMEHAPELGVAMADRRYQRVGAKFGALAGSFLLADEPGLGKTTQSLAALIEGQAWSGDVLIISPKTSIRSVWERQINRWTRGAVVVAMPEGRPARERALDEFFATPAPAQGPRVLVVNPAMIRRKYDHYCFRCDIWEADVKSKKKYWPIEHHTQDHKTKRAVFTQEWPEILDHHWDSVILDESHMLLTNYTPSNIKSQQQVQGLLDIKSDRRIALTGTPLRGHERNIWGTLAWLDPQRFKGYWAFIDGYFDSLDGPFGKIMGDLREDRRDEFYRLLDRYMLRRTKSEVQPELPAGQRLDETVSLEGRHRKQYEEFERLGEIAIEGGEMSSQGVLSELTRLRQYSFGVWKKQNGKLMPTKESPIWERLLEMLAERGVTGKAKTDFRPESEGGFKYVIASQFTEILQFMEAEFARMKIDTLSITGAVTGRKRDIAMKRFQDKNDDCRVMLINTQAGGVSIELDAWCDEMFIVDETFIADDQVQLEGRINNRSGRVASRTWWYLRTEDTIATRVAESNYSQHDMQHLILDKRRGVETALHLLGGN